MFPRYLQYLLTDFRQTFVTGASRDRDELIAFWGQKVKCHGHSMTKCAWEFYVSAICPVCIDGFLPNFCHWCILGHRWPDYVLGSKFQSSRSHRRGGGAQHSRLPSSATFSSVILYPLIISAVHKGCTFKFYTYLGSGEYNQNCNFTPPSLFLEPLKID